MPKRRKVVMARTNPQWKEKKALLQAVVDGDVARVVQLCDEGVPPDKRAVHAAPFPIEVAVALGNYELAEALFAKKDAYYDVDDVLPFLALYYLHIPTLLVRNIKRGNRWAKIDLCIGKLTEVNGD